MITTQQNLDKIYLYKFNETSENYIQKTELSDLKNILTDKSTVITPIVSNKYKLNSIIVGTSDGIYEVNNLGQAGETSQKILYSEVPASEEVNMHSILYGTSEEPDLILVGIGNKLYMRDTNSTVLNRLNPKRL